ncbi:MAG: coenzyme F420-0:L-glutamate ligase [Pelolinea sp.]|nr:coenzyme F420-0:L-glutamate ligase [Pelolinea sp.]
MTLIISPITSIPDVKPGDHVAQLLIRGLTAQHISLIDNDILVVTQKIISKSENRYVDLSTVIPSEKAFEIAITSEKCPELIELILQESKKILRMTPQTIITEHNLGFISANSGIDHSNVGRNEKTGENWVLLLPNDPDASANNIREFVKMELGANIGVMIIDSHGRAWRYGTVGTMIGTAGVPAIVDLRGKKDLYGYQLKITRVAAADELAGTASLIMGQANEKIPAVHVRGFPYPLRCSSLKEVIRPEEEDLFR